MYSVYILTVPDGRKYVGTTAMPVKRRWNHGNGYRFCQPLWEIIRAVGWEAIVKEVVGCNLSKVCKGQRGSAAGFVWKYV